MRVLFALTYYRPHISGLTIYVQRLAEALAAHGDTVTVLTSRYDRQLPREEMLNGVRVVRAPVAFRVSKGVIMPTYPLVLARLARDHDAIIGNLPNTPIETIAMGVVTRMLTPRPLVMTYHCDVRLPPGRWNRLVDEAVFLSNLTAAAFADRLVAYTDDYANFSRVLRRFPGKRAVIPPPVVIPQPTPQQVMAFRHRFGLAGKTAIGFVARFATEKGVEYAVEALPRIRAAIPNAVILFAGEYRQVIGEAAYWAKLEPALRANQGAWTFTGVLSPTDPAELASFYAACAVTILPSINSTESFGLVQVESMLCGTPVIASDLPGVRVPVQTTGMGEIVPVKDAAALAEAVIRVARDRDRYVKPRHVIEQRFRLARTADEYRALVRALGERRRAAWPRLVVGVASAAVAALGALALWRSRR
ncbi:MAG: glycosyltransferase family 4 protein [Dehalococcoidia bacterium]|nr:glycosyltransferase family 4 protein [Dehalococcoidia bacterium]